LKSRIFHLYGEETARHIQLFEKLCIRHIKFRRRGITQKKAYNIVILAAITKAMFAQSPNPPPPHSNVIFRMQKRIVSIMVGVRNRDSCREYFRRLKILPLQSQYLLSLLLFVAENIDHFRFNSKIHGFNTKNKSNLHLPPSKLTVYQRGPYYSRIKTFNNLTTYVKNLQTRKQFK